MGYRTSWIARRGASRDELLNLLGASLTGERQDFSDTGFYLVELVANGSPWVLLLADGSDCFMELQEKDACLLSQGNSEALFFWCSDTTMTSDLVFFSNGELNWSIRYDCGDTSKRPELTGQLPALVDNLLLGLRNNQNADGAGDVDYIYELTADVGRALIGFRHDLEPVTEEPESFQVLTRGE